MSAEDRAAAPLDTEILALLAASPDDGPAAHEVPIEQARAAHIADTRRLAGAGVPVERVEDTEIAGVPVRVYEPAGARGTVVYLHGGGWVMGSLDSVDAVCRALAVEAGARVVSVDYRLAPEHPFPAGLDDALAVVGALDGPVVVAGDSAGGNLAAVVALKLPVALQLLIYPVIDAGLDTPSYRAFDGAFGLTAAAMQRFFELYLDGAPGEDPDVSPLRADLSAAPPAYVITASHDVLRDEGEAYARALPDAELRRVEGTVHGFWRWQRAEIARATVRDAARVVRQALV